MLYPAANSPKRSVALLVSGTLVAIVAQMFVALPAHSQPIRCEHNGQFFNPGDTDGAYICMPDGTWRSR